jgi:hypothetical protein
VRALFVIGGIVAIIAGIVVLLLARSNDDASAQSTPPPAPRPRVNPNTTASDRPAVRERTEAGSASPSRDTIVGDAVVRDHRAGDHLTRTAPSIDRQQRTRLLPVALTKEITSKVDAIITSCTAGESHTGARLEADVTVAIASHTLTVTAVSVAIPGATGLDGAKRCIEERAVGLSTTAGDLEDIADYKIGVSFRLP